MVATGLKLGGKPGRALNVAYENLGIALGEAYPNGRVPSRSRTMLDEILKAGLTPTVDTDYERWKPLHWIIAVPDVMERGGFDAIIGNPPFLGGQKLTGAHGHATSVTGSSTSSRTARRAAPTWSPTSSCVPCRC